MKKFIGLMLCLSTFVLLFISASEKAFAIIPSDYEYSVSNGEVTITGYTGASTDISIPEEIDGMVVTRIGENAFYGGDLTSVIIPNTVTEIGSTAFSSNQLTSITIPNSVVSISDRVFTYNNLEEVILADGLQSIGDYAFSSNRIASVTIPDSVTSLGKGAFFYNQIATLSISTRLTSLNDAVFMSNALSNIVIPEHITSINSGAFHSNALTSVTIPEGVTYIGEDAFSSNALTSVTIPNSVTAIGNSAFSYNKLTHLSIPNSVTTLGYSAFSENELTSVTLSDNLTSISYSVFYSNNLTDITIPASVTSISDYSFSNNNLSTITFLGSLATLNQEAFFNQTREGHTFRNWYSDEARETAWDFSNAVTANTTLYAGYDIDTYTVSFDSNGGSNIADMPNVNYDTLIMAQTVPTKSGFIFDAWYKEPTFSTKWDFNVDRVKQHTTIYAKWNSAVLPITPIPNNPVPSPTPAPIPSPTPTPTPTPTLSFNDIEGHWAEELIMQAVELGILTGYADGSFKPNGQVTREEFAVMLAKALKLENVERSLAFSDGDSIGGWAVSAIERAVQHGILNGYPDGSFRPQANVTRAELAVIIANALAEAKSNENSGYIDDEHIPAWAKASVALLKQYGIMQGRAGYIFDAQGVTTRAEALTALLKLLALRQ